MEQWCEQMGTTKENPEGTDCLAHIAEGRIFKCPYKNIEDWGKAPFPCQDCRPKTKEEDKPEEIKIPELDFAKDLSHGSVAFCVAEDPSDPQDNEVIVFSEICGKCKVGDHTHHETNVLNPILAVNYS